MTYEEIKEKHQKEVNALPMYWAFSDEQYKSLLDKLSLTEDKAKEELFSIFGAIIKKSDKKLIIDTLEKHSKELKEYMNDLEFFKSAVIYEMKNHEYSINWQGDYDTINALGFKVRYSDGNELNECDMTEDQKQAYIQAKKEYMKLADLNDWY